MEASNVVDNVDNLPHDSRESAHNKPSNNNRRIRMSWIVILLLFLMLGLTAILIVYHAPVA